MWERRSKNKKREMFSSAWILNLNFSVVHVVIVYFKALKLNIVDVVLLVFYLFFLKKIEMWKSQKIYNIFLNFKMSCFFYYFSSPFSVFLSSSQLLFYHQKKKNWKLSRKLTFELSKIKSFTIQFSSTTHNNVVFFIFFFVVVLSFMSKQDMTKRKNERETEKIFSSEMKSL